MPQPNRRRRIASCLCVVAFLLARDAFAADTSEYFPPPDSAGGWRTLSDPVQIRNLAGIEPRGLEAAYALTERSSQHGGLLVVRHGYLVFERYFGKGHRNANPDMASTGKAF